MKRIATTIAGLMLACAAYAHNSMPKIHILDNDYYAYTVQKGESLYGIAKKMNWDEARLTAFNPKSAELLSEGSVLFYPVNEPNSVKSVQPTPPASEYTKHTIASGETLYGVAKRYNTSIEDIVRANPDISETNFQAGRTIRVLQHSNNKNTVKEMHTRQYVASVNSIKVRGRATWEKIAAQYHISPELLRKANPGVAELEKNMWIAVPVVESQTVEVYVPATDPREQTATGRREIVEEVKTEMAEEQRRAEVRIALVLDDASTNKDCEFTRGFLMGLDDHKDDPYKINVKILEAKDGESVDAELQAFSPGLVISTSEKDFPTYISEYCRFADAYALNVFDIKSDSYANNPQVIKAMTPSGAFNEEAAKYLADSFGGLTLLVAGEPEEGDTLAESLLAKFSTGEIVSVSLAELEEFIPDPEKDYLVYATPQKKNDVRTLLDQLSKLRELFPLTQFSVVGRPSWITLTGDFANQMASLDTYIPSRFYFDPSNTNARAFINEYKEEYNHTPIKSYPVYSAMGFDVANYFIPAMSATAGDLETPYTMTTSPLQTGFYLVREGAAGLYNAMIYILHCTPSGIEKIPVK